MSRHLDRADTRLENLLTPIRRVLEEWRADRDAKGEDGDLDSIAPDACIDTLAHALEQAADAVDNVRGDLRAARRDVDDLSRRTEGFNR